MEPADFSVSWTTTWEGVEVTLPPYYRQLVAMDAQPTGVLFERWTRGFLQPILDKFPDVAESLWETVLACWRLRCLLSFPKFTGEDYKRTVLAFVVSEDPWVVAFSLIFGFPRVDTTRKRNT